MIQTENVLADIEQERIYQITHHDENLSLEQDFIILVEEVGEVAQALQAGSDWSKASDKSDLYSELIQVAAVAVKMAEKVRKPI